METQKPIEQPDVKETITKKKKVGWKLPEV